MSSDVWVAVFGATMAWGMVFGGIGAYVASQRGRDPAAWALICGVLGFLGLFVLAVVPPVTQPTRAAAAGRHCGECGGAVMARDRFCRSCGTALAA